MAQAEYFGRDKESGRIVRVVVEHSHRAVVYDADTAGFLYVASPRQVSFWVTREGVA